MAEKIRWGILGTGNIANRMADALKVVPDAELRAVGSRTQEKGDAFAHKHGIPVRHSSYEALAADPDIDIIYVCTPHTAHADCSILCLEHGKSVVCEKPLTVNAAQAEMVVSAARKSGRFLMEAMWTRFLPSMAKMREVIQSGRIGEVRMLQADFGFRAGWDPSSRLLNPELAGGGLLDVGVYTIALAYDVMGGAPEDMCSAACIGETGVDEQNAALLKYSGGRIAILSSAVRTTTPHMAFIMGTEGMIRIPSFWCSREVTVSAGGKDEVIREDFPGNGFEFEAQEAIDCVRAGKQESAGIPLDESVSIVRTMDALRAQWGLKYPFER